MKSKHYALLALLAFAIAPWRVQAQSVTVGQDFEGADFPPQGWVLLDNDKDGNGWMAQSGSSYVTQYSGSKCLAVSYTRNPSSYSSYGAQDNWIITPEFEVKNNKTLVQFVYAAQDLNSIEPLRLLVSEGGTAPSDFTEIWYTSVDNGYDDDIQWSSASRSLSAYAGKTIRLAVRHQANSTYGLSIDNFYVFDQTGPKQPTGFSAVAATDDSKAVTLSWTNPSKNAYGDDLTALSIAVYRDGEKIAELTDRAIGADDSYTDTPADGTHIYTIAAKNDAGEGLKVSSRSVYVGEDIAKAITEVTAMTLPDGTVELTWIAPTKGVNNGFINAAGLRYKVYRDGNVIASDVEGVRYVDVSPVAGLNAYTVTAVTGGGESGVDAHTAAYVTDASTVDVQVAQTAERDNALTRLGMDLNSQYSVNQSIYYPSDFNFITGDISDIVLKAYHGTSSDLIVKGRIYISDTDLAELNGWVSVAEEDKVFDGEVVITQGATDVVYHLASPYKYKGGNIVITWIKDGNPSGSYSDRFYSMTTDHPNRTHVTATYAPVDISNMPVSSYSDKNISEIPSTRFLVTPREMGSVEGVVTCGGEPVEGVIVSVDGYAGLETITGADGKYMLRYVPVAATSLTVSKTGYEDVVAGVVVADGQTTTADVAISRYANFVLSGKVTAEDTGLNAVGAVVALSGYEDLETTVGADGRWSVSGVYVGKDYTITVSYPIYDVYTAEFNYDTEGDREYAPVVLERALIPAWNVVAEVAADGSVTELTWSAPTTRDSKAGMKSIGDVSTQKYTGGDYSSDEYNVAHFFSSADLVSQKMYGLVVSQVRVFIKATEGTFTAKVWRGTRENNEEIASQLIPASDISADGSWVTVKFDNPAELKPGAEYLIGVNVKKASSSPIGEANTSYISGGNNVKWSPESSYSSNGYSPWCIEAICEVPGTSVDIIDNPDAPKCAYNVYRGVIGDNGAPEWTKITTSPISELTFSDTSWPVQASGRYVYGVSAVYNKAGESEIALSDKIDRASDTDVAVAAFVSPVKSIESQETVTVTVTLANHGELPVSRIPVSLSLNGEEVLAAAYTSELKKGETADFTLGEITLAAGMNVLVATASAEGDEVPANDALTFELPNFENIALCGYRWDAYGNAGFMTFGSNNPEAAGFRVEVTPNDALVIAGDCVNGTFYGFTATWWGESREFVEIDADSWTVTRTVENTDDYVLDMAYDYAGEVMYCIAAVGADTYFGTVDLSTGIVDYVAAFDVVMRSLACDLDGRLYAVDADGQLYKVAPETAEITLVGNTGAGSVSYLQSMAFDHNTGRLFWAHTNAFTSGELLELDPATGASTRLGTVMFNGYDPSEIVGLYSPYKAPAKSFAVLETTPGDGEEMSEFAGVTVTCPAAVTADTAKLASITFSAEVNGWKVAEGDGTATLRLVPVDELGNGVTVAFEPEKTYTLVIPEGTFLKANGDYSETITLSFVSNVSGVENVLAPEAGKVRYFNLQGVEVKNPAAGAVYIIVHSDGSVTKEMLKK